MLRVDFLRNFEILDIGEIDNISLNDFMHSFRKFFSYDEKPDGFIQKFGRNSIGEIDNPFMKDFEVAFETYFYEIH
jgi:hypothetical protein